MKLENPMQPPPELVLFDMDHTLIHNDCDVSWKCFMRDLGRAPQDALETAEAYYHDYLANRLAIEEFMDWQLQEIKGMPVAEARALAQRHFNEIVEPHIYPEAMRMVRDFLTDSVPVAIVTSTNSLIAAPVAEHFGIDTVLATELEIAEGRITGGFIAPYMTGEAKVVRAREFCDKLGIPLGNATYFGDSTADIPLLQAVGHPHVVNPKPELLKLAREKSWPIHAFTQH
jgi:HAD superfamily hydrolase (TIGR01490 family)